jgi:diaminohydroxyphosphoribosylaminopyrimidine deaminase/5-amino-6-(5-phosphoribosylamino)uracil reductase
MSGEAPGVYAGEDPSMRHELLQAQTAAAVRSAEDRRAIDLEAAWRLLLLLSTRAPVPRAAAVSSGPAAGLGFVYSHGRWLEPLGQCPRATAQLWFDPGSQRVATVAGAAELAHDAAQLLELFLPLLLCSPCSRAEPRASTSAGWVVGHLGQSLDGRVATPSGASQFITGHDDVVHTHRLRALAQAVLVGVRTVQLDDPQLTTRLVPGPHPVRVVLDPTAKLERGRRLLEDQATPTLVVTRPECCPAQRVRGEVEWLGCPLREGCFDLAALLGLLRERGLTRVFVEGGGVTVSSFLAAGLLDRLHVSVAPLILGSGAPAFALPPIDRLDQALALRVRHFTLGCDMLFDCQIAAGVPGS